MEFELRHQSVGLVASLASFALYVTVIVVRAVTDHVSLTNVAWQGPLLLMLAVGGGLYALIYGAARWRIRGRVVTDERDVEISRRANAAGSGLTALAALVAMIMMALGVGTFWVVHVILVGSFLGSIASSGATISAYMDGLDR